VQQNGGCNGLLFGSCIKKEEKNKKTIKETGKQEVKATEKT